MTQEEKAAIISYRKAGLGYSVIAKRLGRPKSSVAAFCQKNGLGRKLVGKDLITSSNRGKVGDARLARGFENKSSRAYKVNYKFRDTPNNEVVIDALQILKTTR